MLHQSHGKNGSELEDFWKWIVASFWHGVLITGLCFAVFDCGVEADTEKEFFIKSVTLKDTSTVVFNIVLHVIFVKLSIELERVPIAAVIVILLTIALNYLIIVILSLPSLGDSLENDLGGVGARSVFSLNAAVLLVSVVLMIGFLEYLVRMLRLCPDIKAGRSHSSSRVETEEEKDI